MKQLLLICAVVMSQSVLAADKKPLTKEESAKVIEAAIRKQLKKPTGELTKADLEKVPSLLFYNNKLTEVPKGLEKLTQLRVLNLAVNKLTNVKGLENLTQLTNLNLQENKLTSVKSLEKLTQLPTLESSYRRNKGTSLQQKKYDYFSVVRPEFLSPRCHGHQSGGSRDQRS